jgi:hypothetical protein
MCAVVKSNQMHNLRERHVDPISHTPIPQQRLHWLNGHCYDILSLARTLHSTNKVIDPLHQTPLNKKDLQRIDEHLATLGSTVKHVACLLKSGTPPEPSSETYALEEMCNQYMEQLYTEFEDLEADIITVYGAMPPLLATLRQLHGLDEEYALDLCDIYIHKLRGPPNRRTPDGSGLLQYCLHHLRTFRRTPLAPPPPASMLRWMLSPRTLH